MRVAPDRGHRSAFAPEHVWVSCEGAALGEGLHVEEDKGRCRSSRRGARLSPQKQTCNARGNPRELLPRMGAGRVTRAPASLRLGVPSATSSAASRKLWFGLGDQRLLLKVRAPPRAGT